MGRTLDTLKKATGPLLRPDAATSAQPDGCVLEWAVSEAQVPFIEVGAPNKVVEGSADVLAAHPPQAKQPPHPPTEKAFEKELVKSALMAQLTEARPVAVAYEPWTGAAGGSGRIAPEVIVYHQPAHAVSRQYAELVATMAPGGSVALLLAGVKPQVGATTVLVNLAVAAASAGRRVLVIDGHLERPGIAARLGCNPEVGLEHVLAGQAALDEAIVAISTPSLHILPAKERSAASGLSADAAAWLLKLLRPRFDLILIDGPVFASPALAALAAASDALYLVAPRGEAIAIDRGAVHGLARKGGHLRGILHTHLA